MGELVASVVVMLWLNCGRWIWSKTQVLNGSKLGPFTVDSHPHSERWTVRGFPVDSAPPLFGTEQLGDIV